MRVTEDVARSVGMALLSKLEKLPLQLVEIRDRHYMRLRIDPKILMMGAGLFAYAIDGDEKEGGALTLERSPVTSPWALLLGETVSQPIKRNTLLILRALEDAKYDPDSIPGLLASSWEKNLGEQISPKLEQIGLRKLWRRKKGAKASLVGGIKRLR